MPAVGGMLLFGRDRLDHFPDAWIQAERFAGTDKAAILDHVRLDMHPVQAIEEAVSFVEKHSARGAVIGRLRRRVRWSLPPAAVRETIVNAVVSRGLFAAGRADPGRDIRRPAGGRESGTASLRPHPGGLAARGLQAQEPRVRAGLLRSRAGRAVGKRGAKDDRDMPRQRVARAGLGGNRGSPAGHYAHRTSPAGKDRPDGPNDPRPPPERRGTRHP